MSQKRETYIYVLAALIAGLSMLGIMFIITQISVKNITKTEPSISTNITSNIQEPIKISFGDKILITQEETSSQNLIFQTAKQRGTKAMAASGYSEAIVEFEKARSSFQNSPETLIYLNNAKIGVQKSHTIAVVVPISAEADSSLKMLRGIAQAQDEINKEGGINGSFLRVIIADDKGKPEIAKQVASELAKKDDVLAVVGHHSSGSTLAAKEIYDSQKLVAISSVSTSVELSANPNNAKRYVFRTVPSDAFAAKALANYMLTKLNKEKAAVFYDPKSRYSQSLKSEFVQEVVQNQGQVVDEFELSNDNFNASNSVNQAIQRGAQVLMLAAPYDKINNAISVVNVNKKRLYLLGGDDIYNIKILQEGESRAEEMVFGIAWSLDSNPNSEFVRKSRSTWNADVDWKTAMTYDATQALIAALKINPSRSGVQEALSSPDFQAQGVSDTIRFVPSSGDRIAKVQLVQIQKIPEGRKSRSGTGFDFVFLPK